MNFLNRPTGRASDRKVFVIGLDCAAPELVFDRWPAPRSLRHDPWFRRPPVVMRTWPKSRSGCAALATFRRLLPSWRDLQLVFAAIALPVFAWSIVNVLREMPSWVLRLRTWDLVGVIAYMQAFARFETLVVLLAMILLAVMLPGRLNRLLPRIW